MNRVGRNGHVFDERRAVHDHRMGGTVRRHAALHRLPGDEFDAANGLPAPWLWGGERKVRNDDPAAGMHAGSRWLAARGAARLRAAAATQAVARPRGVERKGQGQGAHDEDTHPASHATPHDEKETGESTPRTIGLETTVC